ncbi:MAG: glycosyltransferase family 4 protein, partial [Sphingomonadales bacterium]|nr:glycosyltransferase family 4 protein [Sphingomonadales bacterium]
RLAKLWKADLIFTPAPEGYLGQQLVPQVVMVHDLRPLSHPERSLQSLYFRSWVPSLLRQSRHILTNSSFTASEILRIKGIDKESISITPLGFDASQFYPLKYYQRRHPRPYFLHIGQAYPHKNLRRVIEAFSQISEQIQGIDLILAGKPYRHESACLRRLVDEKNLSNRILFLSYVNQDSLPDLYRGAVGLIYPSLWEGFGLPIIESMACGVPVITSYGSATEEVAGQSALLVDPLSIDQIRNAILELVSNRSLRTALISRGLERSTHYSWTSCKDETRNIVSRLIGNS